MERDDDLIRELLIDAAEGFQKKAFTGYTKEQVGHHYWLLGNGGLMEVIPLRNNISGNILPQAVPKCLKWAGHDFLKNARSDTVWNAAKDKTSKLGGVGIDVLKELLAAIVKTQLGLQ